MEIEKREVEEEEFLAFQFQATSWKQVTQATCGLGPIRDRARTGDLVLLDCKHYMLSLILLCLSGRKFGRERHRKP